MNDFRSPPKPILYSFELSPGVRSVRLVAAAIGLELDIREVDLFAGQHLSEQFVKLNPQHTVPTLDDNGNIIWDSHAIVAYLVGKYAKNDLLYPTDLYQRAKVDQRLHFDSSILWPRLLECNVHIYRGGVDVPQEKIDRIYDAYELLEAFLVDDLYLVGNTVTIADLCAITTVGTLLYHAPTTTERHPKIVDWIERVSELPYYHDCSGKYVPKFHEFLDKKRSANKSWSGMKE